ncbi:unnamed protein product [Haemonchus placei]|uniref:Uncharacterized protein n=1 Tax=Haemonchus placei TaxID=6290 RepID=A0A0N4XBC1_HAEPC|nr:unnamed protein product [Haemonchus placei]
MLREKGNEPEGPNDFALARADIAYQIEQALRVPREKLHAPPSSSTSSQACMTTDLSSTINYGKPERPLSLRDRTENEQ